MQRKKLKFPIAILWWEVLATSIASWFVKKILDFLWARGKYKVGRFSLKPSYAFEKVFLRIYFTTYIENKPAVFVTRLPWFPDMMKYLLRLHRTFHRRGMPLEDCSYCKEIMQKKDFLQGFAPNPKLYPPFKF